MKNLLLGLLVASMSLGGAAVWMTRCDGGRTVSAPVNPAEAVSATEPPADGCPCCRPSVTDVTDLTVAYAAPAESTAFVSFDEPPLAKGLVAVRHEEPKPAAEVLPMPRPAR